MGLKPAEHGRTPRLAISADRIFDGYRWHDDSVILIEGGVVQRIAPVDQSARDWPSEVMPPGTVLAPGFIDLQVNGGGGILLNDAPTADAMRAIARAHRRYGTTSCLPTLISDTSAKAIAAIAAAKSLDGTDGGFGSSSRRSVYQSRAPGDSSPRPYPVRDNGRSGLARGAIRRRIVDGDPGAGMRTGGICEDPGREWNSGVGWSQRGGCRYLRRAIDDGLSGVTHLFNAMPAMSARQPGIVGVALADQRLTAGIIVDGIHVDPIVVRAAFAAKNPGSIALVSDAMPTIGTGQDHFELMGRAIELRNGRLVSEDGTLAGAHLELASAVKNAVTLIGISLDDALRAASLVPARFLGIERHRGTLDAGARADIVALTAALDVLTTWIGGKRDE
jgi:N-acetylglucosamine-6-phosphate deacetylase